MRFLFLLFLSGCSLLKGWRMDAAFEKEYGLENRDSLSLPSGPRLILPVWLVLADWTSTSTSVNSYVEPIKEAYPDLPWQNLTIYIHPHLDWCVNRYHKRVNGWREHDTVYVTWEPDAQGYPRTENPLAVLPWEIGRWVAFQTEQVAPKEYEGWWKAHFAEMDCAVQSSAKACVLSDVSKERARSYQYIPWTDVE